MTAYKFPRSAFIGFDGIFDELERMASNAQTDNYPPHNIVKLSDDKYQIEIAVVGFKEKDLELKVQDGILYVNGSKTYPGSEPVYLHKGISGRSFRRSFRLSEHVEVKGADLRDGLLVIGLERIIPEEKRPRVIPISTSLDNLYKSLENTHDTENKQLLTEGNA